MSETTTVRPADHVRVDPAILYFGTPVVLLSTENPDGTTNIAPISSVFWLGHRAMLGVDPSGQSSANMARTGEVVLCLPSVEQAGAVDALALTTGTEEVPESKQRRGYRFVRDKVGISGLTPVPSELVAPPRFAELPVAMEARVDRMTADAGCIPSVEVEILRVHAHPSLLVDGSDDHIDPDRWRPLIMSFQRFYGLTAEVHPSWLASVPEHLYR